MSWNVFPKYELFGKGAWKKKTKRKIVGTVVDIEVTIRPLVLK